MYVCDSTFERRTANIVLFGLGPYDEAKASSGIKGGGLGSFDQNRSGISR
jgi:hypothetical protein